MAKVAVRFLRHCDLYNGGEIAGFDEEQAGKYVDAGFAKYLVESVERAPVAKAAQPPASSPKKKRGRPRKKKQDN